MTKGSKQQDDTWLETMGAAMQQRQMTGHPTDAEEGEVDEQSLRGRG